MTRETRLHYRCVHCGNVQRLHGPAPCPCGGLLRNLGRGVERLFPLGPLVEIAASWFDISANQLRAIVGVNTATWTAAWDEGLTFVLADRWSVMLGLHPVIVWGDAWIHHALNDQDRAEIELAVHGEAVAS